MTNSYDEQIRNLLKNGGVGFMPSDTIYGLSCRALDSSAVKRLHQIKQRDQKPFIILIFNTDQLNQLGLDPGSFRSVLKYWPGKLTAIGRAEHAPGYLHMGTKTLAVRQPNNPDLRALIDKVGPIISTSANLSGQEPARSFAEAQRIFGNSLDFYIDAGLIDGQPSTIVKIDSDKLKLIRQGEVHLNEI